MQMMSRFFHGPSKFSSMVHGPIFGDHCSKCQRQSYCHLKHTYSTGEFRGAESSPEKVEKYFLKLFLISMTVEISNFTKVKLFGMATTKVSVIFFQKI